jgi:hypothetical protein
MAERGRPSIYTPELADQICEMLSAGMTLRSICQEPQMPCESAVRKWALEDRQGFYALYTRARDIGLDCMADLALEAAATPVIGEKRTRKGDGPEEITTGDTVDRSRLHVDALKWYLCKLAPKRYGERQQIDQRFVDEAGKDRDLGLAAVRAYAQQAPTDGE